jgi:hypothetical protein
MLGVRPTRMQAHKALVVYDQRVRWVAAINLAFFAACIWFALRFCSGFNRYILLAFCTPFCLFWIRDLLFGFRLMLVSDGCTLRWQERKEVGSVALAQIRKVLIGVRKSGGHTDLDRDWTYIRFQLSNGTEQALPPNIASGLRSRNWRHLKRLVSHIRTVSEVPVEPIREADLSLDGWEDEPQHAADGSQPSSSAPSRISAAAGSRRSC